MQARATRLIRRRGACGRCKDKKARCDGLRPICSACARAGKDSCIYDNETFVSCRTASGRKREPQAPTRVAATSKAIPVQQQITPPQDIFQQMLTDDMTWDLSSTQERSICNTAGYTGTDQGQADDARLEALLHNASPRSSGQMASELTLLSPVDLVDFNSSLNCQLGLDSSDFSAILQDTWLPDNSIPPLDQQLLSHHTENWLMEPPSRLKSLASKLFPANTILLEEGAGLATTEHDQARNTFGCKIVSQTWKLAISWRLMKQIVDSSIFTITSKRLESLSGSCSPHNHLSINTSVKALLSKIRHRNIQKLSREDSALTVTAHSDRPPRQVLINYLDAFFDHSFSCYFTKTDAENWFASYLSSSSSSRQLLEPIVNSILGIGCRIIDGRSPPSSGELSPPFRHQPEEFCRAALAARAHLLDGEPSVLKIQSLVTMALLFHGSHEEEVTCSLISQAVQVAISLRLHKTSGIQALVQTTEDGRLLKRLFWVLYALEKPLILQLSRYSFIDDTSIDHAPEFPAEEQLSPENFNKELFLLHSVHHAKVCSVIMKSLYCFTTSRHRSDVAELARSTQVLLDEWHQSLPEHFRIFQQEFKPSTERNSNSVCHMVDFSMKYHEAVLVIHQRGDVCVQSARTVLSLTHLLECDQTHLKWTHYRLFIVSYLIVLADLAEAKEHEQMKRDMSYLLIANGWFGRLALSLKWDFGFTELLDLSQIAQGIWKSARGEHDNLSLEF